MVSKVIFATILAFYIASAVVKSGRVGELNSGNAEVAGLARAQCDCSGGEFKFNCSDKADGNYPHPSKCFKYVACVAQKYPYEMTCANDLDGRPLHFNASSGPDEATSRCVYRGSAPCACDCPPPP